MKTKKLLITLVLLIVAALGVTAAFAQQGGPGGGGPGGPGGRGGRHGGEVMREIVDIVAEETGLDPMDIMEQVRAGSTLADIITANGGDVNAVITAAVEAATTEIEARVTAGEMTRERADEILSNLEENITNIINGEFQPGRGGPGRGEGRGFGPGPVARGAQALVDAAAEATGLTHQEIIEQVRAGSTLAEVITANGANVDAVIDAAVTDATEQINAAVTEGRITQEEADTMIAELETVFTEMVNGEFAPQGPQGHPFARGVIQLAAEQTGLTVQEIREQLRAGNSLATILTDNGVDVNAFIDLAVSQAEERLSQAVENGRLTQEEADARLAEFRANLTERINQVPNAEATQSA